ncbi:cysteine synthase A [Pseudoclavibacter sp. CFCC 13796]|uniref:cysteine synthase A n=1 Tax=Pseudoclavibacter sp. CFCC 13796 TaxID=2615179 RepID=UPI00130194B5|nr:cysteine synthase A [Pseudoclavibacter sp. CFCC 13796]KAB1660908.1 cysteine synthase A [Pseudoclavibacter sp. CFCC 13796]
MAEIHDSILDTIGNTPLVRLHRLPGDSAADVLAKVEFTNPAGSVKDRLASAIVEAAERSGELKPGGTIVEGTSGNTGIGLAFVGAAKGYHVVLTMPETMSVERRVLARAYGAEIVLTPGSEGMKGAVAKAKELVEQSDNAILASQFANPANAAVHRATTGPEIVEATKGRVDYFIAGIGTGGTLTGAGQIIKAANPEAKVIGVEPSDSPILNGGKPGPHKIQGIGANFVPDVLDTELCDEIIDVEFSDATATARALASEEGILAGISAGAATWAALEVAKRPEAAGKTIVVIIPDFGERYLSTSLYSDLLD